MARLLSPLGVLSRGFRMFSHRHFLSRSLSGTSLCSGSSRSPTDTILLSLLTLRWCHGYRKTTCSDTPRYTCLHPPPLRSSSSFRKHVEVCWTHTCTWARTHIRTVIHTKNMHPYTRYKPILTNDENPWPCPLDIVRIGKCKCVN